MVEKNGDVPAIIKMNLIFDLLGRETSGLGQAAICSQLKLPKATVSRLINTLCVMGYLEQKNNSSLYTLGAKLLALGNIVNQHLDISAISGPHIEKLSRATDEMVKVSIIRGDMVYPILCCESSKPIRITLDTGTVFPPYIGAAGKLLLAMTEKGKYYLESVLPSTKMKANTKRTITSLKKLSSILDQIKIDGYAVDYQEESDGIHALAVPIYDSMGVVIGALSIPFFGDFQSKKDKYLPLIKTCANEISKSMGLQ